MAASAAADDLELRRTRAALATPYLPPDVSRVGPLVGRQWLAPGPVSHAGDSMLVRMLELRLHGLAGPRPADPRRNIRTGDFALRVPLGEAFLLRPGLRIEYERHPVEDTRVSLPMPTLGLSMRF